MSHEMAENHQFCFEVPNLINISYRSCLNCSFVLSCLSPIYRIMKFLCLILTFSAICLNCTLYGWEFEVTKIVTKTTYKRPKRLYSCYIEFLKSRAFCCLINADRLEWMKLMHKDLTSLHIISEYQVLSMILKF